MKILYLLPPSEGKNQWWIVWKEKLSFLFSKPLSIAVNATEKDLKCTWVRYEQGIEFNTSLLNPLGSRWPYMVAIERYSWVMYNAINYSEMNDSGQKYFDENFLILSWMYGLVRPQDMIWNYKLPIETRWLYTFWWNKITETLNTLNADYIVDLLPNAYKKMIQWEKLCAKIIKIDFFSEKNWEIKKMTHGVKKVKWAYLHKLCVSGVWEIEKIPWVMTHVSETEIHIRVTS